MVSKYHPLPRLERLDTVNVVRCVVKKWSVSIIPLHSLERLETMPSVVSSLQSLKFCKLILPFCLSCFLGRLSDGIVSQVSRLFSFTNCFFHSSFLVFFLSFVTVLKSQTNHCSSFFSFLGVETPTHHLGDCL